MINEKPQYVIDAERRYNHMRNVVDYIDNNFNKYSSIVKYAKDNWGYNDNHIRKTSSIYCRPNCNNDRLPLFYSRWCCKDDKLSIPKQIKHLTR